MSRSELNTIYFATVLVHEATHAVLESRSIKYTPEFRSRIEKLCVTEENRFLKRLALTCPDLVEKFGQRKYDESEWKDAWNRTHTSKLWRTLRRSFSE